ncbi:MAG TPA: CHAT domain-containing protein, partial [Ferruginibacter sp.]|nr:CHAT domain-containing protein [Ferruginibacter sp.]
VSNGDLYYSAYPVLVGHFLTDGITSAEAIIDRYCDNTLREWHRLNLYPGDIGTGEVFINTGKDFRGAVVIGLGAPGRLSGFQLARSVEQGTIKYLLELKKTRAGDAGKAEARDTGISVLLIGCGYGGLSIESSVRSILQGVQNANNKIGSLNQEGLRSIEHIEFVELYEDRSLQCLLVLNKIAGEEDGLDIRMADRQMKKLLGSRTRIPMDNASDWWSRISIALQREKNEETGAVDTALRFSSSTGSAREEQRDLQSNPVIVNRLIEDMSVKNRWSADLAKTVFELMIPNDFKDDIKKQPNTMWVLDTAAAAYPWELLQDSMTNARPICCTSGMIRQLQTDKYRLKINAASGNKVLVVGDPELNGSRLAPQLPGALEEAKRVAELLGEHGYEMPNNCMRKQASQIVQAVFKDEYRIMHLAGHGIFNEKDPDRSGMLIGDGIFLSTREICQMSKVPDLVFVNCCYLGKVSGQAEETMSNRYKLAANIGTQLIMNGVKVVIAAGWAVDDANALLFAKRFYTEMLRG